MGTGRRRTAGTADAAARTLRLLTLLDVPGGAGAADLADRLGISARTVRRDVQRLRELGYTVRSRPGPGAGYELVPSARRLPLLLEEAEVTALVTGLEVLAAHAPNGAAAEAAGSALTKLVAMLPPTLAARARAARVATEVLDAGSTLVDAELAGRLADAIAQHGRLTFEYTDAAGTTSRRTVDPHRHVLGGGHWYLVGFDVDRDDWRTFRLDRIDRPHRVSGVFARRPFPALTAAEWFATDFGRRPPLDRRRPV